jgi:hypothetical protein
MSQPVKVVTDWLFDEDQFSKIGLGHEAHKMEDKWNIYLDGTSTLYFHRSWTGFEIFKFTFQKISDAEKPIESATYKVNSFFYEGNKEIYKSENQIDVEDSLYEVMKFVIREVPLNVIGE